MTNWVTSLGSHVFTFDALKESTCVEKRPLEGEGIHGIFDLMVPPILDKT